MPHTRQTTVSQTSRSHIKVKSRKEKFPFLLSFSKPNERIFMINEWLKVESKAGVMMSYVQYFPHEMMSYI